MLHPAMLDDVGPTCSLRLNRPLYNVSVNDLSLENGKQMSESDVSKQILMICSTVRTCVLVSGQFDCRPIGRYFEPYG